MDKFLNSLKMFRLCLAYLGRHPSYTLLGILLFLINASILIFVAAHAIVSGFTRTTECLIGATYLLISFLITYYEAILTAVTIKQLNDEPASVFIEIYHSKRYLLSVFLWSLALSTIGLINKIQTYCRPRLTARFFNDRYFTNVRYFRANTSWTLSTYFVIPMLVAEDISLKTACKQSDIFYGPGWQKNFKISSLVGFVALFGMLIYCGLFASNWQFAILPVFIMLIFFSMLTVTLVAIEKGALYTGCVLHKWLPQSQFNQGLINSAFTLMEPNEELL